MIRKGVFYMQKDMGSGVDFRFAKDGYSMMLNYDDHYTASNVTQMVGRSTRKQGIQAGHAFCNNSVVLEDEPGLAYLEAREKKVGLDNGPKYAKMLARHWDKIPDKFHKYCGNTFAGNKWQMTKLTFDKVGMNQQLRD